MPAGIPPQTTQQCIMTMHYAGKHIGECKR